MEGFIFITCGDNADIVPLSPTLPSAATVFRRWNGRTRREPRFVKNLAGERERKWLVGGAIHLALPCSRRLFDSTSDIKHGVTYCKDEIWDLISFDVLHANFHKNGYYHETRERESFPITRCGWILYVHLAFVGGLVEVDEMEMSGGMERMGSFYLFHLSFMVDRWMNTLFITEFSLLSFCFFSVTHKSAYKQPGAW